MIKKKIHKNHMLGAWSFDNGNAKGIITGAKNQDSIVTEGIVLLLSDKSGKVHLIINQDKLSAIGGTIHFKNYDDPYEPCGIQGG